MIWTLALGLKQYHKKNDIPSKKQLKNYTFKMFFKKTILGKQMILNDDNEGKLITWKVKLLTIVTITHQHHICLLSFM